MECSAPPLPAPALARPILPYMPLPIRTPEETDALKARAREMRAGGASVTETAQALGLPASTLYRWAAEGGWRGRDLARERYRAALKDSGPVSSPACGGGGGEADGGGNFSDAGSPPSPRTGSGALPPQAGGETAQPLTTKTPPPRR